MSEHCDSFFVKGWRKCVKHIMTLYPDIDPKSIMEPQEKDRLLRKNKKTNSLGIQVEDLTNNDSASDFKYDDEDNDDETVGEGALVVQPEPIVVEPPILELAGAKDDDDLIHPPA